MVDIATFKSLKDLVKHVNETHVKNALEREVFEEVEEEMQHNIQTIVYDRYTPTHYERTGRLLETIEKEMIDDNTLAVENTRSDIEYGVQKDVTEIIEKGRGYTWGYVRNLDEEIGPRPFIAETRESLQKSDKLKRAMKKGLERQGIKTK